MICRTIYENMICAGIAITICREISHIQRLTMTPRNKDTLIHSTRSLGIYIDTTTQKKVLREAGERGKLLPRTQFCWLLEPYIDRVTKNMIEVFKKGLLITGKKKIQEDFEKLKSEWSKFHK